MTTKDTFFCVTYPTGAKCIMPADGVLTEIKEWLQPWQ